MFGISIECVCVMLMQRSRCQSLITAQPFGLSLLLLITSSLWLPQLRPARWTHIESEMTRLHSMDKNEPQNLPATPIDQNDMLFLHCYLTRTISEHRWAVCCFKQTSTAAQRHETMASCHCLGLEPRPSLSPSSVLFFHCSPRA